MKDNIFLIDADAFLAPSKKYYRFSIAPGYWEQINDLAIKGHIKTIDKVDKEVSPREDDDKKDEIQLWYENDFKGKIHSTNKQKIVDEYVKVIQYLNESGKYNEKALLEWSMRDDVADPWLIATAKAYSYTVVSMERMINYNGGSPMGSAKIPNVCLDLNVKYTSLFNMMEQLEIEL